MADDPTTPATPAPVEAESLWIQFGSAGALGRTIRKWGTTPFDGGQEFRAQSAPVGGEGGAA